jgi:GPH family glycoside/pentoside/hexuronide:cation symporter
LHEHAPRRILFIGFGRDLEKTDRKEPSADAGMKNARQAPPTIVDSAFSSEKAPLTAIDSTFSSEEALSTPIIIHKNRITMIMLKEKIGYGLGDMASSMFWKLFGSYLMIFYTDVFGMPAAAVGTMFLVTRVWDSAFDPVVGILADRTHSRRGKFRPYLLFLAVPFALIGILTFTTPQWSLTAKIIYAYATYSLMMMVYSAINVPYASLLGVISADPHDRNLLAVYRMLFAYLGSFIALLLFMPMVNVFSRGHSEQYGWMMAVVVIAVACAALFYGCFALTRERVKPIKEVQNPLKEDLKDLFHNRPWWILLGAGIAALVFNSIRDGATVYYFKYFIVEENHETVSLFGLSFVLSGLYLAVGQAANIIGVMLAAPVSNRIGKKKTYMWSMICATLLSIVFYWLDRDDIALIFTFQVLISICAGSIFPLLWSMYADCADYSELKTGNRATGLIFSSSSMSQKFGWAIGSAVTGWLLAYFGFRANAVQNEQAIQGIKMFLSFLPAVGTVLSVAFISLYPLSEKKMKEITEELEERRRN